ncbi:MAG: hypothetical protein ABSG42_02655 [Nitrospirota bacterium]
MKYITALVPMVLTALFAGLAITAEPQVMGGRHGVFDYIYNRWLLIGVAITVIMLIAVVIGDIRNARQRRGH